jgi:hypothetical protein
MRPTFLAGVDLKKLREYIIEDGGDGWTIWSPQKFTEMGFKADDLPVENHQSGEGKWGITHEGKDVESVTGIWNLSFLTRLAGVMGVEYQPYRGRGFQARAIRDALLPVLDEMISAEKGKK